VPCPEDWGGYRVIPTMIEFWQGQPSRMHDRLLYRRDGLGWTTSRLAP
jgi:pyridoxamine 5'-phosphate oxidase